MTIFISCEFIAVVIAWLSQIISTSVLTQYDELENNYWTWKKNANLEAIPDPIELYDDSQKKTLCKSFIHSHNYVYVKSDSSTFQENNAPSATHINSFSDFNADYSSRDMKIASKNDSVKMFRCTKDNDGKNNFYLTYGFHENYAFVISAPRHERKNIVLQALLQPSPDSKLKTAELETKFSSLFWKFRAMRELFPDLVDGNKMNLCSVSEYQHFNICSVVADTLHREMAFHLLEVTTLNHIYETKRRCLRKKIVDPKRKTETKADVLPCVINKEDWSQPQFCLLREPSPDLETSVIVLTPRENDTDTLELFTRIDNVTALTMS